jgi:hypothetical protein
MNEDKIVKTFCTVLGDFLEDLYLSYPDPSLFILKQTTKGMMTTCPKKLVENFMECIDPYKDKLLKKDETFFINGGLATNLADTKYGFLVDELNKISDIWKREDTSKKTKDGIWSYFQVLIQLGSKLNIQT